MARVIPMPLAFVVKVRNMNLLKILIQVWADIHCADNEGHKLAHWAAGKLI